MQPPHRSQALSEGQRHWEASQVLRDLDTCLTRSGTVIFRRLDTLKENLSFWVSDKEVFVEEHVQFIQTEEHQQQTEQESDEETTDDLLSAERTVAPIEATTEETIEDYPHLMIDANPESRKMQLPKKVPILIWPPLLN